MSSAKKTNTVGIRPGVGFYRMIPALPYKPWVALGEMVDNSIQSFDQNKDRLLALHGPKFKLVVEIEIGTGANPWIAVKDNAAGIPESEFERAFTPASPPKDKTGISQYGIGMKSSACWFSKNFFVRTSALGELTTKVVNFDIARILETETDTLMVDEVTKNPDVHGTTIEMRELIQKLPVGPTLGTTKNYLRSIYREWLRAGELELIVAGEKLSYEPPKFLVEPFWPTQKGPADEEPRRWLKHVSFELSDSWEKDDNPNKPKLPPRITGYVAILEKGATKSAGLALLWKKKVIQGTGAGAEGSDDLYRPDRIFGGNNAFERQRIFGELDVSELQVTAFKDRVVWGEGQEQEFLEKLLQQIKDPEFNLKLMAINYRATVNNPATKKKIDTAVSQTAKDLKEALTEGMQPDVDYGVRFQPQEIISEHQSTGKIIPASSADVLLRPMFKDDISIIITDSPGDMAWLRVQWEKNEYRIVLNRSHPFMNSFASTAGPEFEVILRIAVAIGLAEITGKESGPSVEPGFIRTQVNELLKGRLSTRDSLKEFDV